MKIFVFSRSHIATKWNETEFDGWILHLPSFDNWILILLKRYSVCMIKGNLRRCIWFFSQITIPIFDQMFWLNHSTTFYFILKCIHLKRLSLPSKLVIVQSIKMSSRFFLCFDYYAHIWNEEISFDAGHWMILLNKKKFVLCKDHSQKIYVQKWHLKSCVDYRN